MDIISIFESALEENHWEKLFRARIMMKAFWYNKWERFEWAIQRAMDSLADEKKNENFFPEEKKTTGWRPSRDYLITRGWCYILLKFCDGRKSEVQELKKYLEQLYLNSKIATQKVTDIRSKKNKFFTGEVMFLVGILIVFFGTLLYVSKIFHFFDTPENQFFVPKEFLPKQEIQVLEEKYISLDAQTHPTPEQQETMISQNHLQNYIDAWGGKFMWNISSSINPRTDFTQKLDDTDLIEAYFTLWNAWLYHESCSLLQKKSCNAFSKSVSGFANFWEKTTSWHEIIELKKVDEWKYCVKYQYHLKNDKSENFIIETFQYHTQKTSAWWEEITGRFCEKIEKWGRNIVCPFRLNEYVCN